MSNLSKEQAAEIKANMIAKRHKAYDEYNKCVGAIMILDLADGTVDIVDDEPENTPESDTDGEDT